MATEPHKNSLKVPSLSLRQSSGTGSNWLLVGLLLLATLYTGWSAWQAISQPDIAPVTATPSPTPAPVSDLKLNVAHARQGSEIKVDPSLLGKSNPFTP